MPRTNNIPFPKHLLAFAASALLAPATGWTLDLVKSPPLPTAKSTFVAPNVIISVDDSGSMKFCTNVESEDYCETRVDNSRRTTEVRYSCASGYTLNRNNDCVKDRNPGRGTVDNSKRSSQTTLICPADQDQDPVTKDCLSWQGATEETSPNPDGSWPKTARRINVLKYSLTEIFKTQDVVPDDRIRLAWQSMWNNGGSPGVGARKTVRYSNGSTATSNSGANNVSSTTLGTNSMRPLRGDATTAGTHRKNFLDFVAKLTPNNGTPSHWMFSQADSYMRLPTSKNGPWSTNPGGTDSKSTEYLGCRRNYHIMMTDGRWNGTATAIPDTSKRDNATNLTLPDGTAYSDTNANTAIYRDASTGTTLADWAFYSWATPLQATSALKNADKLNVPPDYTIAPATEVFGAGTSNEVTLPKYWNPRYNPATWPHMVTYTIGFGAKAYEWEFDSITPPVKKDPFEYNGSFPALAKGSVTWPDLTEDTESRNSLDLWHAAINGRGNFYAIQNGGELKKAFTDIIGKIRDQTAPLPPQVTGGGSASGYNVSQSNAGIFASFYNPQKAWSGAVTATRAIEPQEYDCSTKDKPNTKCIRFPDTIAGWEGKSTGDRLDALANVDSRLILSWSDDDKNVGGIPFKWDATSGIGYSNAQKLALLGVTSGDTSTDPLKTEGKDIVDYIRGVRDKEGTTAKSLRVRVSRQGDIVNSEIWYTGRPSGNYAMGYSNFVKTQKNRTPVLYVGGNDGMLHGFSATDGKELIGYVPRGVVSGLKELTKQDYVHRYYVDGSPMTGDVLDGTTWKTLLVGTLGAGGKGYFVLDVTNPGSFSSATPSSLVVMDRTRSNEETASSSEADIGNIVAQPGRNPSNLQEATQITRLNSKTNTNGRWAVVMGNGYNSANQRPVLLIQYLDGDKELLTIPATSDAPGSGNAKDNGLASPALVDLDGDGKTDVVYAGDNLGNLWKFDLTSTVNTEWGVAFDKKPLFTAKGLAKSDSTTRDQVQPITAPPIVRPNDRFKVVGTGKDAKSVPVGGMMVAFGTGRNLTEADRTVKDDKGKTIAKPIQTLYSVLDNTRYCLRTDKSSLQPYTGTGTQCASTVDKNTPIPEALGDMTSNGELLAKQTIDPVSGDYATVKAAEATQELNQATWSKYKGWYLDLPANGERLLKPMQFFDGSNILAVYTETPPGTENSASLNINESCVADPVNTTAGSQYRTLVNIMDGKIPTVQLVDYSGDGAYDAKDLKVARAPVKTGSPVLITQPDRIVDKTGGGGDRDTLNRMPEQSLRPSWRQLK